MKYFLLLFLVFLTYNLKSQNLLNDIPKIISVDTDTCNYRWGFNGDKDGNYPFSWANISYLRHGGSLCNNDFIHFYYNVYAQQHNNSFLQIVINKPLTKDSVYELNFNIDPRFSKKKWAKGRTLNIAFIENLQDTFYAKELENLIPYSIITGLSIRKQEIVNYTTKYKAKGNENGLLIYAQSNKREEVVFELMEICLHKSNTTCTAKKIEYISPQKLKNFKNDTFNVLFALDKDSIQEYYKQYLKNLNFEKNITLQLVCIGYADSTGNVNYNLNLSLKRAMNVQKYLNLIYPNASITCVAKGAVKNNINMSLNRKVEIILIKN